MTDERAGVKVVDAKGRPHTIADGRSWSVSDTGALHIKEGPSSILKTFGPGQWICVEYTVRLATPRPGSNGG